MGLLKLEFGGVFARDDALARLDVPGEAVEQGGLARSGAARNDHIATNATNNLKDFSTLFRDRSELDELVKGELVLLELADGKRGAIDSQRWCDDIDARTVGQAGIADRTGLINAPSDLADDSLTNVQQLGIVAEVNIRSLDLSSDLNVDGVRTIDHDI